MFGQKEEWTTRKEGWRALCGERISATEPWYRVFSRTPWNATYLERYRGVSWPADSDSLIQPNSNSSSAFFYHLQSEAFSQYSTSTSTKANNSVGISSSIHQYRHPTCAGKCSAQTIRTGPSTVGGDVVSSKCPSKTMTFEAERWFAFSFVLIVSRLHSNCIQVPISNKQVCSQYLPDSHFTSQPFVRQIC